jgi:serine/threonine-protein kinase/endoribonuclease IRE1
VAFGGPEPFRSGRGLIEASEPVDVDGNGDLDLDVDGGVDAITKARKYRERMGMGKGRKEEGGWCSEDKHLYSDRRCLVGVRPLEDGDGHESRMRRLLDGPAGRLPIPPLPEVEGELVNGSGKGSGGIGRQIGDRDRWGTLRGGGVVSWWEAVVVTIVFCVVSLWFALRRVRGRSRSGKKTLVLPAEEERKEDVGLLDPQAESSAGTGVSAGLVSPIPEADAETSRTPRSSLHTPKQSESQSNGNATPILLADDGEDSEGEGDAPVTPGKRKARRGKRGKKKKTGLVLPEGGEDGGMGSANGGSGSGGNANGVPVADGLPETPPVSSLVVNSARLPVPTTPSLIVSDTILGKHLYLPSISLSNLYPT